MADKTGITGSQDMAWPKGKSGFPTSADERDMLIQWLQRFLGAGKPLDEATRHRAESWFGRNLGDVRIHDSRQAAELAKRLGAEAFAVHSHIFGPAEKLSARTPQGSGLLAHEITHVVQQTDPQHLSQEGDQVTMPREGKAASPPGGWRRYGAEPPTGSRTESLQQPSFQRGAFSPSGGETGRISLQVSREVLQRAAEEEAQASEEVVSRALATQGQVDRQSSNAAMQIDPQELASKVYRLMLQDLVLERERGVIPA